MIGFFFAAQDVSRHVRAINEAADAAAAADDDDDDGEKRSGGAIDALERGAAPDVEDVDDKRDYALIVGPIWKKYGGARRFAGTRSCPLCLVARTF